MSDFSDYLVNGETGFIINQRKLIEISEYYKPWITLKNNLENLMNSRCLWDYVDKLPLLSIQYLTSNEQLYYCHCILALTTSAYVWYNRSVQVPKLLPKAIAVPLRQLSENLGTMPILNHTDLVLTNTVIDYSKNISDKDYIVIKERIINNENWNIFQRETSRIELCFAPIIKEIGVLKESILKNRTDPIILSLKVIISTLHSMREAMKQFNEMDPDYFHCEMRPFLTGWNAESFPHTGGLLYENEDGSTTAIECIGASAGQSPTLQVLDTLFDVRHFKESLTFLDTMKNYMIKPHRNFIKDLPKFLDLQKFIQKNLNNKSLVDTYNECLSSISLYRTGHMQTVTKFIINPAKRVAEQENTIKFLQERGTGGQNLLTFLKEVRDDTSNGKIQIQ